MKSKIYSGKVFHKRFVPTEHAFLYPGYFLKISLEELNSGMLTIPFFGFNSFNLFSFYNTDHGYRNGEHLSVFAKAQLKKANRSEEFDDIVIHTMPRILGYVFNPVSFWYVYKNNKVESIIAEVNNTFGETISYVLDPQNPNDQKLMQVSPFNQIKGHYEFNFENKTSYEKVEIKYFSDNALTVYASAEGTPAEWTKRNFLKLFFKNPIQNLLIMFLIHFEALRLFIKKVPFYGKNGVVS